jgi:hypothetical protein
MSESMVNRLHLVRHIQEFLELNWHVRSIVPGQREIEVLIGCIISFSMNSFLNNYVMETPPSRISSLLRFHHIFGFCMPKNIRVTL